MPIDIPSNLEPLREFIESRRRDCWVPAVVDGDGPIDVSKFAGIPWLGSKEEWPMCGRCRMPMQPFVQVNFAAAPEAVRRRYGTDLLQAFFCVGECVYEEA